MILGSKKKIYRSLVLKIGVCVFILVVFLLPISANAVTLDRNITTVLGKEKPDNFYLYSPSLESAIYGTSTITSGTKFSLTSRGMSIESISDGHYISADYAEFTLLYDYVYTVELVFSACLVDFNLAYLPEDYISNYEFILFYHTSDVTSSGFKPDSVVDMGYGKYKLTYNIMLNSSTLPDLPFAFTEDGIAYYSASGFSLYNSLALPDGVASYSFYIEDILCKQVTNADIILNTPIDNSGLKSGIDASKKYDSTVDEFIKQVDISTYSDGVITSFTDYAAPISFVSNLMDLLYNSFEIYSVLIPVTVLLGLYCWFCGFRKA